MLNSVMVKEKVIKCQQCKKEIKENELKIKTDDGVIHAECIFITY